MTLKKAPFAAILLFLLLAGCAGIPVRQAVKVDQTLPVGKIEGNQFTGIRYPFKVSSSSKWVLSTEPPTFMEDLGYEKQGLEQSQLFIYNPSTQSNVQIDFEPADRYTKFSQESIERLTGAGAESFKGDLEQDYGKEANVEISPTEPISLRGVQFAAKKYATYTVRGAKRQQGWIYGFSEPYQIFILYVIMEKDGTNDRQDMKEILDSFEVISKKY